MSPKILTLISNIKTPILRVIFVTTVILIFTTSENTKRHFYERYTTTTSKYVYTKRICIPSENTLRARRRSCFLRPDTGPCRADIVQWYFDVNRQKCYRFYWGGCQGNGNKFETQQRCRDYCFLNTSSQIVKVPYYCSLGFDYGSCFGHFNRWGWDTLAKTCKRRMYSGCGGNQNNFESQAECLATCLNPPNNTLQRYRQFTTCIPLDIADIQK